MRQPSTQEATRQPASPGRTCAALRALAALGASLVGTLATIDTARAADAWPVRPIRLIVTLAPGGPIDQTARTMAPRLSELLGQSVLIENRPGGNGSIGADLVAHAPADGYTLLFNVIHLSVLPSLGGKLTYDIERDFAPISLAAIYPIILVARQGSGITTVAQLIARARAEPGRLSFGHSGYGGGTHLAGELFKMQAGVDLLQVPFKGSAPAMAALLGDQTDLMFSDGPTAMPHVRSGRVISIAIASPERSPLLPSLPTVIEAGLPGFDAYSWGGIAAPAATPPEIVRRLNTEVVRTLRDPTIRERLLQIGAEPRPGTPAEFASMLRAEIVKWGKVVKEANIRIE